MLLIPWDFLYLCSSGFLSWVLLDFPHPLRHHVIFIFDSICDKLHILIYIHWTILASLELKTKLNHGFVSFLMSCWILFARISLRIFTHIIIKDIGLFGFCLFIWFWLLWLHRMGFEAFLPFLFHGNVWEALVLFPFCSWLIFNIMFSAIRILVKNLFLV